MSEASSAPSPGWYTAKGDPPGTQRYWNGSAWQGPPQAIPESSSAKPNSEFSGLAEVSERVAARFIDLCVWFAIFAVIALVDGSVYGGLSEKVAPFVTAIVTVVLIVAYESLMTVKRGATIGKLFVELRIVSPEMKPVSSDTMLRRMVPFAALALFCRLLGVIFFNNLGVGVFCACGVLFIGYALKQLFEDDKLQTLWDKFAKTMVVKKL